MDNKKTKRTDDDATPHQNIPDLPIDIIVDIISRLRLKSIIGCKLLSNTFKNLISCPSFSHIYLTNNKSKSLCTINLDASKPHCSFDLVEFSNLHEKFVYTNRRRPTLRGAKIFNTERLRGRSSSSCELVSMCCSCNGLICLLKLELGVYNLFVINPILGEFIQLPELVEFPSDTKVFFSYGLGYCQMTNRYKVLRLIKKNLGDNNYKTESMIFTVGPDHSWRNLKDVNVPYHIEWVYNNTNLQSIIVPMRSALHWIVQPEPLKPNCPARICICAFDMTEEKVHEIQLPPGGVDDPPFFGFLSVLLDKLFLGRKRSSSVVDWWVMDEYGVESSWTKKFVIGIYKRIHDVNVEAEPLDLIPLTVLPEPEILVTDSHSIFFCDFKKHTVRGFHQSDHVSFPIPFVPSFVSLMNLVHPCPLAFEGASAPSNGQLQLDNGPRD